MLLLKDQSQPWIAACVFFGMLLLSCITGNGHSSVKQRQEWPAPAISATARISGAQKTSPDARLIQPGRGVGALQLGDTRERVYELLGKKPIDQEHTYGEPCSLMEIHWLDPDLKSNGLFIYLKAGRVFQIASSMPRYVTANGVTVESSPENVRQHHRQLQTYILLSSGSEAVGGRELIYWIDRQNGIAFEFYYNNRVRGRRVSKIIVFEPGTEFRPEGCISPPQKWRQLEPFALEPPKNSPRRQ